MIPASPTFHQRTYVSWRIIALMLLLLAALLSAFLFTSAMHMHYTPSFPSIHTHGLLVDDPNVLCGGGVPGHC